MSTTRWQVTGMTCGHCVNSVTEELTSIAGVTVVSIDLVSDGVSTVTVNSSSDLTADAVTSALSEAGEYQLVGQA